MRIATILIIGVCFMSPGGGTLAADESGSVGIPLVYHAQIDDQVITPVTPRFIGRALSEAEAAEVACFVIELNTPGGYLPSTQEIVTRVLASRVPVVVYVSPSGGRAASAGVFITLASHVAAMAPGTRIGAAHPVPIGSLPFDPKSIPEKSDDKEAKEQPKDGSAMEQKLLNDTVAWARSLAELRGRNADWAEVAVTKSDVLVTKEAIKQNVVELEAKDISDLMEKIHGRKVTLQEEEVQLRTAGALVRTIDMWWGESLLAVISNPNVVMILLMFGVYGIMFEMYSPGWGVGGTLGVVCLLLAFFGLSVLPVNYVGLALVFVALAMFVAEAFVTSFGALTLGGIICLILGGTMLVDSPDGFIRVSMSVLIPIAVSTAGVTVFLVSKVVEAHRGQVQTGSEGLIGKDAVAQEKFVSENGHFRGQVFLHGELWQAHCASPIADGQTVRVNERGGLVLTVEPNDSGDNP